MHRQWDIRSDQEHYLSQSLAGLMCDIRKNQMCHSKNIMQAQISLFSASLPSLLLPPLLLPKAPPVDRLQALQMIGHAFWAQVGWAYVDSCTRVVCQASTVEMGPLPTVGAPATNL